MLLCAPQINRSDKVNNIRHRMTNLYTDDNSNDNDGTYDAHDGDGDSV